MKAGPVTLLVVDDHPVVQDGVALLLQRTSSVAVAGYARSGAEAIQLAQQLRPDIVLLDLRLPDMLAPEIIPALRRGSPHSRVIVFTAYADHAAIGAALDAGASGVLTKDCGQNDLLCAIRLAASGEPAANVGGDSMVAQPRRPDASPLTPREYAVFRRMATGETCAEIAEALGLTYNTAKTYLQRAMQKLGARNRVEAINKANEIGLL
jgi:DNA-binding NarL/FixJ family response regulator